MGNRILFPIFLTFVILSVYLENVPRSSGQLISLPSLGNVTGSGIIGCKSNAECTPLCQFAQGGDGTCVNGHCKCQECPLQTVALVITSLRGVCAGSQFCPCPVQADGGGPSFNFYSNLTVYQGHVCITNLLPLRLSCVCFCAQTPPNSTFVTGGLPINPVICPITGA